MMKMAESYPDGWKTLWEKEKLLVTSNFSFSHSVFKRLVSQGRQKVSLCGNGLANSERCESNGPCRVDFHQSWGKMGKYMYISLMQRPSTQYYTTGLIREFFYHFSQMQVRHSVDIKRMEHTDTLPLFVTVQSFH